MKLLGWIPPERLAEVSITDPQFVYVCAPVVLLVLLCISRRWAVLMERPIVFALVYSMPYFCMGFGESWGDSVQWIHSIGGRYFMSEPGATWIHHWAYRFLHKYCNLGISDSIAFTSRVAGLLYLWIVALLSQELFPNISSQRRLLFRCLYFVAGVSLLFYGYVENTPIALPLEQLWVLTSVVYIKEPSWKRLTYMSFAMAAATLSHGRVSFYAPVLGLACFVPHASMLTRFKRAVLGGGLYVLLVGAAVAYILVIDSHDLVGGPWGNVTGGGNRQMFSAMKEIFSTAYWASRGTALLVSGGLFVPISLIAVVHYLRHLKEPLSLWILTYVAASICFVGLWEFDYGIAGDWDLVFSAALPFILLTAVTLVRGRLPVSISFLICAATAVNSLAFGAVVNGRPFGLTIPPTATSGVSSPPCTQAGVERTYFSDTRLSEPLGPPETDVLHREWSTASTPLPTNGHPFGARYRGYVYIPDAGRYRIPLMAQGNIRLVVGEQVLFERWRGLEVRATIEREVYFPAGGWYPILVEFYTVVQSVPLKVSLESNRVPLHVLKAQELCH